MSLLVVDGIIDRTPGSQDPDQFEAEAALLGGHTTATMYDAVHIRLDVVNGWADPEPLAHMADDGRTVLTVDATTLAEVRWRDLTIRLRAYPVGRYGPDVQLDHQVQLEIEGPATSLKELIDGPMRALQDLFIVMIGEPVITSIFVRPVGADSRDALLRTYFHTSQPEPSHPGRRCPLPGLGQPDPRGPRRRRDRLHGARAGLARHLRGAGLSDPALCAPMYAPFMYLDTRYTFVFQAVEQIAKSRFGGQERSTVEHNARVDAVIEAWKQEEQILDEDIAWVKARLQTSDYNKLTTLLTELFEATGKVGKTLLEAKADVGRVFTDVRGPASHGARGRRTEEKYWLERALSWVARVDLLHSAGAPLDILEMRVTGKPEFTHAVRVIRGL